MATGGSDFATDEISEFPCSTCTNKSAVKYCVECQGYCCKACVDAHSRFPALKGHTLLDASSCQTPGSSTILPAVPTERCSIHTIKLLDMYCRDHDEVSCTTCMALNHRSCKNVHSIPDDIDMLLETTDLESINQALQSSKGALEDIQKKKRMILKYLDSSKNEAHTAIEDASKDFVAIVKNIASKSKEDVESVYQTSKTCVEKDTKEADGQIDDLNKVMTDLQTSEGNKAQQFVCMKIANRKIKEAKEVETSLKTETEAKVTFQINPNVQEYFRNMKTIGKVSSVMTTERSEVYTVTHYKDMNVKLQQDSTTCYIYCSCWTEDGLLLLVDHNNKKLKRANITSMTVDGYCNFDYIPYWVCSTSKQEAVVTFFRNANFIQFVTIGNQLTPSRKVQINHTCLGITFKDNKLYITDAQTVYIHDMVGNELQAISQDSSRNDMFCSPRHIAFNDVTQCVFVADQSKGVIILDGHYQPVATFTDSELSNAMAVCTDRRGNLFVCGYNSHNVIQIGYDGKKRGVVVDKSHGVQNPDSVCFDLVQCRLIVTQYSGIVKIFDLQ